MTPRTEKAIKAWLALPERQKGIHSFTEPTAGISLQKYIENEERHIISLEEIARFTIASIVKKRYPKRKKKVKK